MSSGLAIERVEKRYGEISVLSGATASFESGRVHVLTGPSGSGKTTLLRLLAGLEAPDAGEVTTPPDARLAMTFQEDRLCDNLTVTANIRLPHAHLRGSERTAFLELEREACAAVGLPCDARPVRELSGGQRRRVAMLRCVLAEASILLFDEPLKGMDEKTVDAVMRYVVPRLAGRTALWVTHDDRELSYFENPTLWRVEGGLVSAC